MTFLRLFACFFAPLLAGALAFVGVGILALRSVGGEERAARRAKFGKRLLVVAAVFFALFAVTTGIEFEPYIMPERYVGSIMRTSAPLIEAIDKYKAERGEAPVELEQLVPKYIAVIPETGYRGHRTFGYMRSPSSAMDWELYVSCDWMAVVEGNEFLFRSTDRTWRKTFG